MDVLKTTAYSMEVRKLTDWFAPDVSPVHVGMYQRDWGDFYTVIGSLDYWDGKCWFIGAAGGPSKIPATNNKRWRGLAEKPTKKDEK